MMSPAVWLPGGKETVAEQRPGPLEPGPLCGQPSRPERRTMFANRLFNRLIHVSTVYLLQIVSWNGIPFIP
jgi:hypothetical protein